MLQKIVRKGQLLHCLYTHAISICCKNTLTHCPRQKSETINILFLVIASAFLFTIQTNCCSFFFFFFNFPTNYCFCFAFEDYYTNYSFSSIFNNFQINNFHQYFFSLFSVSVFCKTLTAIFFIFQTFFFLLNASLCISPLPCFTNFKQYPLIISTCITHSLALSLSLSACPSVIKRTQMSLQ